MIELSLSQRQISSHYLFLMMEATRKRVHMANGPPGRKSVGVTAAVCGPGESFTCHAAGTHFFVPVEEPWLVPRFFKRGFDAVIFVKRRVFF